MAYIQADVDIMNQALRRVGAESIVLTDANSPTSKPAKVVTSYYDNTIREVLRLIPWNSAISRAQLTGSADSTTNYAYKYSLSGLLPYSAWKSSTAYKLGDFVINSGKWYVCVKAGTSASSGGPSVTSNSAPEPDNTVNWFYLGSAPTTSVIRTLDINGDDSIPYKIEGTNLYCNESSPVKLRYVSLVSPPFTDSLFVETVVSRLASKICFALCGDPNIAQLLYQEFTVNMALAKQLCVSEDRTDVIDVFALYTQVAQLAIGRNKVEG